MDEIAFVATVARIRTLADGGLRFEFDVGEDATMQAAQLMECKRYGAVLNIRITVKQKGSEIAILETGAKRKSEWKAAKVPNPDINT